MKKNDVTDYQLQVVKNIMLMHKGKNNAIKCKEISKMMGFPMEDTQSKCRSVIKLVAEKYNLPILANKNGHYVAKTRSELEAYVESIDRRIEGLEARKNAVLNNFK